MYGNYTEHPGSGTIPKTSDTERQLLVKILLSTNAAGGGGGGGSGQTMAGAFANPNGNVTPTDQTKGAIYTQNGAANNNVWRWDTTDLVWYQSISA